MIDRHSPSLIRVIRAHKRIPGEHIVRLSTRPISSDGYAFPACAFREIGESTRRELRRGPTCESLKKGTASVTRPGHEKTFALDRAELRFYASASK